MVEHPSLPILLVFTAHTSDADAPYAVVAFNRRRWHYDP